MSREVAKISSAFRLTCSGVNDTDAVPAVADPRMVDMPPASFACSSMRFCVRFEMLPPFSRISVVRT